MYCNDEVFKKKEGPLELSLTFMYNYRYSVYITSMVVEPSCQVDMLAALISRHVSGLEYQRSHGKELAFTIPLSEVSNFSSKTPN